MALVSPPPTLSHQSPLMGEAPSSSNSEAEASAATSQPEQPSHHRTAAVSLEQPSHKRRHRSTKVVRVFRSVFRSLPIISPTCKLPPLPGGRIPDGGGGGHRGGGGGSSSESRVTGTLYGYRKGRVSLAVQESPRTLPTAVVELAMQTNALQKEMASGMVRVALECERRPEKDRTRLLEEPLWTMYCNGKKTGYGVRREATPEDLEIMEMLRPVSMGAGVIPSGNSAAAGVAAEGPDGELAYMRADFERVAGSKDSETLYMISPEGNTGPELSIFFVRI